MKKLLIITSILFCGSILPSSCDIDIDDTADQSRFHSCWRGGGDFGECCQKYGGTVVNQNVISDESVS